jgi:phage terminase large subunit-like protein
MAAALEQTSLQRWLREPQRFIAEVLRDPESGQPFELFAAEREFLSRAYQTDDSGRLVYPEQLYSGPKKIGKSALAALHLLTTTLVFGGRFSEGYAVANDLEQAQGRVFLAVRRICEASPHLKREAEITASRVTFPQTGATITALGSDYAGAAGANPVISSFDELWGYTSERSRRLWDEMVPSPARKISARLTTTYAGFEGESTLLEDLYKRGLKQPQVAADLHAGDGLLMYWTHEPQAPWQTEGWLAEMRRSLRPNQYLRMIENRFVTSESGFVEMSAWDRCVNPALGSVVSNPLLPVWIGVDASVKHDSTAIVAVTFDSRAQQVRLCFHRVFQPTPDEPLDFEATIEATLLDLAQRFQVRKILFDPFQMQATAQRLERAGLPIEEFPQSSPNLTAASQNLYELIQSGALVCYPDAAMRLAISRAVAVETPRGWRLSKATQSHKIDVVVALAMAAHAAVQSQHEPSFDRTWSWVDGGVSEEDSNRAWQAQRTAAYLLGGGRPGFGGYESGRSIVWR